MHTKWRLKRIGIWSAIKICGTISGVFGLITGIIWGFMLAFLSLIIGHLYSLETAGIAFAALVLFPFLFTVFYGFLGIIFTFIVILIFNLAAGIFGGVQIEIDEEKICKYKMRMK